MEKNVLRQIRKTTEKRPFRSGQKISETYSLANAAAHDPIEALALCDLQLLKDWIHVSFLLNFSLQEFASTA